MNPDSFDIVWFLEQCEKRFQLEFEKRNLHYTKLGIVLVVIAFLLTLAEKLCDAHILCATKEIYPLTWFFFELFFWTGFAFLAFSLYYSAQAILSRKFQYLELPKEFFDYHRELIAYHQGEQNCKVEVNSDFAEGLLLRYNESLENNFKKNELRAIFLAETEKRIITAMALLLTAFLIGTIFVQVK